MYSEIASAQLLPALLGVLLELRGGTGYGRGRLDREVSAPTSTTGCEENRPICGLAPILGIALTQPLHSRPTDISTKLRDWSHEASQL